MALFGSTSETVRGSTESHLTRPGMEPAILGLPGTCRGRKLGDKPTVDIGSTSIFMQSPISFAWLRTRPVRRPHWISNPYSRTDKSEAAADGRTSESAPSFRLGVLLLLPQLDARIRGRREDPIIFWTSAHDRQHAQCRTEANFTRLSGTRRHRTNHDGMDERACPYTGKRELAHTAVATYVRC